jgi:hypothetical protein
MKEQSQIDAMRAAVRGDLDRARARRDSDPWRPVVTEAGGALALEPVAGPEPEREAGPGAGREPEAAAAPEPVGGDPVKPVAAEPEPDPAEKLPRQGFFSSLFKRD